MSKSIFLISLIIVRSFVTINAADSDAKAKFECPVVIGIDLGTTYSCLEIYKNGLVDIIPNELGNRIAPSVLAFTDKERLFENPQ